VLHETIIGEDFFRLLAEGDEKIARVVAAGRCRHCGGPLHRADYRRKPRGGRLAEAGEAFKLRHSLCCGREGCRKRALPPSLRFLGRRVYVEAVVLLATAYALLTGMLHRAKQITGVPVRTIRRWRSWWRENFPRLEVWTTMRASFVPPPPDETKLPLSLLDRLAELARGRADPTTADAVAQSLQSAARLLAPVTTQSVPDGSRFVAAVFRS
jgi:hypothetical protein